MNYGRFNRETLKIETCDFCPNEDFRIRQEIVGNFWISTVWLPIEHWGNWFECYVFPAKNGEPHLELVEVEGRRTRTYSEAIKVHEEMVIKYGCL